MVGCTGMAMIGSEMKLKRTCCAHTPLQSHHVCYTNLLRYFSLLLSAAMKDITFVVSTQSSLMIYAELVMAKHLDSRSFREARVLNSKGLRCECNVALKYLCLLQQAIFYLLVLCWTLVHPLFVFLMLDFAYFHKAV